MTREPTNETPNEVREVAVLANDVANLCLDLRIQKMPVEDGELRDRAADMLRFLHDRTEALATASAEMRAALAAKSFQAHVQPWMMECFGAIISANKIERNHRFIEEALELVQATGCTASEAHQLVDYVYGRKVGAPWQEVGGVMVTLAALCLANGMDMHAAGEHELQRIWGKVDQIRAKQRAKPAHSPLPEVDSLSTRLAQAERERDDARKDMGRYRLLRDVGPFRSFGLCVADHEGDILSGPQLDAAIDAFIAREGGAS